MSIETKLILSKEEEKSIQEGVDLLKKHTPALDSAFSQRSFLFLLTGNWELVWEWECKAIGLGPSYFNVSEFSKGLSSLLFFTDINDFLNSKGNKRSCLAVSLSNPDMGTNPFDYRFILFFIGAQLKRFHSFKYEEGKVKVVPEVTDVKGDELVKALKIFTTGTTWTPEKNQAFNQIIGREIKFSFSENSKKTYEWLPRSREFQVVSSERMKETCKN